VLEGGEIAGIVTERDYARKIALQGRSSASTRVDEVMTRKVHCVLPRQTSEECMSLMTSNRMRHLPVISETRELRGLIRLATSSRKSSRPSSSRSISWNTIFPGHPM
jgi:CBS domain-containing protein